MLTKGLFVLILTLARNIFVCVVSLYNYSMVYYLLVFSHYLNLNATLFTINKQHTIV